MMARAKPKGNRLALYVLAYLVFLYLPVALIPLFSLNNAIQAAFPLKGLAQSSLPKAGPVDRCAASPSPLIRPHRSRFADDPRFTVSISPRLPL